MKQILTVLLILLSLSTFGQEFKLLEKDSPFKTVYNRNLDSIKTLDMASGSYLIYFDSIDSNLKAKYQIINGEFEGKYLEWYRDGRIHKDIDFHNGLFHGIHKESMIIEGYYLMNIANWINGKEDKNIQIEW